MTVFCCQLPAEPARLQLSLICHCGAICVATVGSGLCFCLHLFFFKKSVGIKFCSASPHKISGCSGREVFVCSGREVFVCSGREVSVSACNQVCVAGSSRRRASRTNF
ncbi:hypothetical protein [Methanimicrococcus hongohii]|uniref:hypothetical protein n=1 Tax=Methanimicrococcus hongohii TaxID=3028295 RepID=UPI00292CE714|nr:hypothetical protein [Methanimicrococcus sp. Hf6]